MESVRGRKAFQVKDIKWSYRKRGRVARAQTNKIVNRVVNLGTRSTMVGLERFIVKNKAAVRKLIIIILMYSAIKIKANPPALYSILNPDTSSDSPSAKSNGVRLVSARIVVNHIMVRGVRIKAFMAWELVSENVKSRVIWRIRGEIRIRAMVTSYEIVCAILRRAPSNAYLELEDQPAPNVAYTFMLERHKNSKIAKGINKVGEGIGYNNQRVSAKVRLIIGARINGV